jgi:EAL domain-containing protein (putative c-di-GMP-specific phosphodiesterase class I)
MGIDNDSTGIVETILTLAEKLGKKAVAEGVETEEQVTALRTLGCGYAQGYLFSRPLWPGAAERLLSKECSLDSLSNQPAGRDVEVVTENYAM